MGSVIALPTPTRSDTSALLMSTLAFEAIVDALVQFMVRTGQLESPVMPPTNRAQLRERVVQIVNELQPRLSQLAERAAAESLRRSHDAFGVCNTPCLADAQLALAVYRESLRGAPVIGVGELK